MTLRERASQPVATRNRAATGVRPRRRWSGRYLYVVPAVVYLVGFMFYPLAYTLYLSVHDVDVSNFIRGGAEFIGARNYIDFLSSRNFAPSLVITLAFTFGSLLFQHVIGFAFAMFFNRRFPLAGLLQAIMLVVWVLPPVVSASLWRWIYSGSFGLLNEALSWIGIHTDEAWLVNPRTALAAVIVANIWVGIPFHMLLLYAGLQGLPGTIYEAASIDGTSRWQRFRHLTLPLMRPVMLTTLLLGFIHTFKVFDIVYVMTAGGPADATSVLSIVVYQLSFDYFRLGLGAAAANVLLVIPLIISIIYIWFRRREDVTS